MTMTTEQLAEAVKRYLETYEAMVAETGRLAAEVEGAERGAERKAICGKDFRAAHRAWKGAQANSVSIIRQLTDIVRVQHEALENTHLHEDFMEEGCEIINEAITLSAPIVKEEV
jgi:hypothetical protein